MWEWRISRLFLKSLPDVLFLYFSLFFFLQLSKVTTQAAKLTESSWVIIILFTGWKGWMFFFQPCLWFHKLFIWRQTKGVFFFFKEPHCHLRAALKNDHNQDGARNEECLPDILQTRLCGKINTGRTFLYLFLSHWPCFLLWLLSIVLMTFQVVSYFLK